MYKEFPFLFFPRAGYKESDKEMEEICPFHGEVEVA